MPYKTCMTAERAASLSGRRSRRRYVGRCLFVAALLVAAFTGGARSSLGMTLDEAVRAALRTNPDVLISRDDSRVAAHEARQARAGYYPLLDLRGATGIEQTSTPTTRNQSGDDPTLWRNEAGVTLRQMLFDGFATRGDVVRSEARLAAAGERVKVSANSVALAAVEAYLEVLRNRELVRLSEENVREHVDVVQRARARAGLTTTEPPPEGSRILGRGDTTELPRAEARLAGTRAALEQARGRLRDAEASFVRIVGVRPGQLAPVAPLRADLPPDEEAALNLAVERSPAIRAANKDIDAASGELQQADARFMPRVDLELAGNRNKNVDGISGMSNDATAMLVMRYNLYSGGADTARRRASLERIARARNVLLQTRRDLEEETQVSWSALVTARDRVPILQDQVRQSSLAREAYRGQFELGRKSVIDLLDAEADYFGAISGLVTGELTARFGEYRLLSAIYGLFPVLGLADPDIQGNAAPAASTGR